MKYSTYIIHIQGEGALCWHSQMVQEKKSFVLYLNIFCRVGIISRKIVEGEKIQWGDTIASHPLPVYVWHLHAHRS